VANRQNPGNQPDVLKLEFAHDNPVERHRQDVLQWCQRSQNTLANDDLNKVIQEFEKAPRWDSPVITINTDLEFRGNSNLNTLAVGAVSLKSQDFYIELKRCTL